MAAEVILKTYKSNNIPDVFLLNYYTLTTIPFYLEIVSPYSGLNISNLTPTSYTINIGDYEFVCSASANKINCLVPDAGSYNLSIKVNYSNNTYQIFNLNQTLTVYREWPSFNYENSRILSDINITLPYSLEDVKIKPNEFGVADIINSSISKINDCILFLKNYSTVIFNKTPTKYIGWLGVHTSYLQKNIQWYTCSNSPDLSLDFKNYSTAKGFNKIIDVKFDNQRLYVLHDTNTISVSTLARNFENFKLNDIIPLLSEIPRIKCIDILPISEFTTILYIVNSSDNKIYKIVLYFEENNTNIRGYIEQIIGETGKSFDAYKFNNITHLSCNKDYVIVVDNGNSCIKKYSTTLGWIDTYQLPAFLAEELISVSINLDLLFILAKSGKIYVLDQTGKEYVSPIILNTTDTPIKHFADYIGEFIYVIYSNRVEKYSIIGSYVNIINTLPAIDYKSGHNDYMHNIYVADNNRIFKFQDIVETTSIINSQFNQTIWSKEELSISSNEFLQDWSINRSLIRLLHNATVLRKSIHSKFSATYKYSNNRILTEYVTVPISLAETTECKIDEISVGVNELALSQVVNRELEKIYNCVNSLKAFIQANYLPEVNSCKSGFCWSWDNTSCIDLNLPLTRVCNINPISFIELESSHSSYAGSNRWVDAYSDCCPEKLPPTPSPTPTPTLTPTHTSTPAGTPAGTPALTPDSTPVGTPASTPATTPGGTPLATPGGTPLATPEGTPLATPAATPGGTPLATPEGTPLATPAATPEGTPLATPAATPEGTPAGTPASTPASTPAATPAAIGNIMMLQFVYNHSLSDLTSSPVDIVSWTIDITTGGIQQGTTATVAGKTYYLTRNVLGTAPINGVGTIYVTQPGYPSGYSSSQWTLPNSPRTYTYYIYLDNLALVAGNRTTPVTLVLKGKWKTFSGLDVTTDNPINLAARLYSRYTWGSLAQVGNIEDPSFVPVSITNQLSTTVTKNHAGNMGTTETTIATLVYDPVTETITLT